MMDAFFVILVLLFSAAIIIALIAGFLDTIAEPLYIWIFKKPFYLYFYPITKKLTNPQKSLLVREVAFYRKLSDKHKAYFEHRVAGFIATYTFYGKDGIVISDEIKVMVASSYIMLTFGMRHYLIEVFDKIIIYPESYFSTIKNVMHNGEFNPHFKAVVFSWKHFQEGYLEGSDNLNLGIHEFAHVLHCHGMDSGDNSAAIFSNMYAKIMEEVQHPPNAKRLIDSEYFRIYAYTNQFEFLAVILEHFFETPTDFRREFPALYENVRRMINYNH